MVKCDDFVYIFHGERFAKWRAPINKILVLEQSLGNKLIEVVEGALTVCPLPGWRLCVAEPLELFQLKCASHRYTADNNSTHFKRNNPLVCRVFARYNHGSTGSKQVYLAWRRVYNHSTAHPLLIYRNANVITNLFQT
jgi:hypothetical protein